MVDKFLHFHYKDKKYIVRNVSPRGLEYDKPIADDEDRLTHKKVKGGKTEK